jgi:hypothetical protein
MPARDRCVDLALLPHAPHGRILVPFSGIVLILCDLESRAPCRVGSRGVLGGQDGVDQLEHLVGLVVSEGADGPGLLGPTPSVWEPGLEALGAKASPAPRARAFTSFTYLC